MPFFFMMPNIELWKHVVDDQPLLDAVASSTLADVTAMAKLRSRWSTDEITIAANLVEARHRAAGKLTNATTIVADPIGVQQATSSPIAAHKAKRFLGHEHIVDLCCGIGADLHALPSHTVGVDSDPLRCWMAKVNTNKVVHCADVTTYQLKDNSVVHIDPSRRDASGKRLHLEAMEPPLSTVISVVAKSCGGCIKLSPAINPEDVQAIEHSIEIEYIEEKSRVLQAAVWYGSLALHPKKITATSLTLEISFTDQPHFPPYAPRIGAWLLEPNPALERAGLHGNVAAEIGAHEPSPNLGLLTMDASPSTPWCTPFEVLETTSLRLEKVAGALRRLGCTQVEVKTRGKTVDPNQWQKKLNSQPSGELLTVFALRLGKKRMAIITRRQTKKQ